MSDWQQPQRVSLRGTVVVLVVVACAVALFMAGRWSVPYEGPATASSTLLPTSSDGIPYGYEHSAAGAQAAAINVLVAGLRLRSGTGAWDLGVLEARGLPDGDHAESPATRLLLNKDVQVCTEADASGEPVCSPGRDGNPQVAEYDFAPPAHTAGVIADAAIAAEPQVTLDDDAMTATVAAQWRETRITSDGTVVDGANTDFVLDLVWWEDDWKLLPDGVTATRTDDTLPVTPWLKIVGFVGQSR